VPVVNALSDHEHPCQALADLQTIIEHRGDPAGKIVTYIGDGNNVANSLMLGAVMLGAHMRVATPADYEPVETVVMRCEQIGQSTGGSVEVVHDPHRAAEGANVLYTDVWASMGQEAEASEKKKVFSDYQIDSEVLAKAAPDAIVLHCLPAHRGEEISADVIDGPQSVVWDEAENRMHAQKALLGQILA
jgi:ornithine carbamoyltransferase